MIRVRYEANKAATVEMDSDSADELIEEAVCIVGALVHELSDLIGDQAAEDFLTLVRRMDEAGSFRLEMRGGRANAADDG